ncbi:uncharacterized protein SRS1_21017 [Sporisorium reilianum f. sp. reilianum]|uniref:Uncharacterized protein n=1 Tax=Sporisorium reilianum f. sp. reilianum TaxID=72559 RepID=A0A2N8UCN9_9BASI|nr:uncharacterized protein SRS1_21017 [Sporisorium reilianum f. sp. reilianum]
MADPAELATCLKGSRYVDQAEMATSTASMPSSSATASASSVYCRSIDQHHSHRQSHRVVLRFLLGDNGRSASAIDANNVAASGSDTQAHSNDAATSFATSANNNLGHAIPAVNVIGTPSHDGQFACHSCSSCWSQCQHQQSTHQCHCPSPPCRSQAHCHACLHWSL